ncbi:hypothetical protein GGX14DRAFT_456067 [Mycena pura]|uniref:SAC3/GANP/THP3 conserved domain-containing protein n=1 Tax=Mycena pura TaxID=153505 RepID=A0AAD6V9V1_9AGAR|nr:hypothetical protein GGX14DRAFT_456067 [Mycena pura]
MEISLHPPSARGMHSNDFGARRGGRNKHWVAPGLEQPSRSASSTPGHSDAERRDRGRGRGRDHTHLPRINGTHSKAASPSRTSTPPTTPAELALPTSLQDDPVIETPEERELFYQELVKQREIERKTAIADGKMDDPLVPKRLEDAISIVGTCMDMCPRFERYRRERENNLFEWETIPGTKRVDHKRAVKMYERAAGDKTLPSDLRPPLVLKKTLDYLFHDLLPRGGFSPTFNFIRDRSRAVRNDFTMQHITSPLAMECHERCARFHILALYLERDRKGFSLALEEQQLMNTLQSLKEFYNDQRGTYQSPAELEMRIYHRLIHIRDQVERPEPVPLSQDVAEHPMYKLTTAFRAHVQEKSKPISKTSELRVGAEGMQIFGELAREMMGEGGGGKGMVFLVACMLERLFGQGTVEGIEEIRGGASWGDIIDNLTQADAGEDVEEDGVDDFIDAEDINIAGVDEQEDADQDMQASVLAAPLQPSASGWLAENFGQAPAVTFGSNAPGFPAAPANAFANLGAAVPAKSVFGPMSAFPRKSVFSNTNPNPFAPTSNQTTANGTPPTAQNGPTTVSTSAPRLVDPPLQDASPPSRASSSTITAPPRVQNNPFIPSNSPSPFSLAPSSLPPSVPTPNTIWAPTAAKPVNIDKDKGTDLLTWGSTPPSSSTLNPKAAEFTLSSSLFQPHPQPAKPTFGVTPIPLFNGFPTSASSSMSLSAINTSSVASPVEKTTPLLAKIDTSPPSVTVSDTAGSSSPLTPTNPPLLSRVQPISLPSTPTAPPVTPSSLNVEPSPLQLRPNKAPNPLLSFLKDSLQTSNLGSGSSSGTLSPLFLGSPSVAPLRNSFSPAKPQASPTDTSPARFNGDIKGKGKERADVAAPRDLEAMALAFEQRGLVVRRCLALWQKRTTDRAEWAEAVRRSEKYSEKVRREREKGTLKRPSPNGKHFDIDNKRLKLSRNGEDEPDMDLVSTTPSSAMKRSSLRRKRYETPRTDEDLAKRFKENQEEHAQRWAQGSFLRIVQTLVKARLKSANSSSAAFWRLWLSLNPESDATAIWLECKFDIHGSGGQWEAETVFSIPVVSTSPHSHAPTPDRYPGLIVFECTPLEDVEDSLERKYRILDDCSRLRDIIKAFPEKRHFVPCLLLFVWSAAETTSSSDSTTLPGDMLDMIKTLVADSVISSFRVFCVTAATTDLDGKLQTALSELEIDVEGRLVQSLTLKDVFKLFDSAFNSFISDCIENCSTGGHFDWKLYCRLLEAAVSVLNKAASLSTALVGLEAEGNVLPAFRPDWDGMRDSDSTFDAVMSWLDNSQLDNLATNNIATDLQSHRDMGRGCIYQLVQFRCLHSFSDFPSSAFVDHLRSLALYQTEIGQQKGQIFFVSAKDIEPSVAKHDAAIELHRGALIQAQRMDIRRSPRRRSRSLSEDSELTSPSLFKRQRIASNYGTPGQVTPSSSPPRTNGRTPPSPSARTVSFGSSSAPVVTVAMLRALTKDMKSRYGKTGGR